MNELQQKKKIGFFQKLDFGRFYRFCSVFGWLFGCNFLNFENNFLRHLNIPSRHHKKLGVSVKIGVMLKKLSWFYGNKKKVN